MHANVLVPVSLQYLGCCLRLRKFILSIRSERKERLMLGKVKLYTKDCL